MSSLQMIGPQGATATSVVPRLQQDNLVQGKVSPASLQASADQAVSSLARKDYVDAQDAGRPSKSYVDQQDGLLIPNTQLGLASTGIAKLDSAGRLTSTQLSRTPNIKKRGPYGHTMRTAAEAYYDSTGQWDQWIATINIPAPGSGFGLWRPFCIGRGEAYVVSGASRPEFLVQYGSTIVARGRGFNQNTANGVNTMQGVTTLPYNVENNSTPAGWSETTSIELRIFLRTSFIDSRCAMGGANTWIAWAQPI